VNAVTRVITEPGTVIRLGRRVGVVLDATLVDVRVVAAGGTETWPLADIATSTATDTGTAYLVRALDMAKGAETAANTALADYEDRFAKRKRTIQKIAHREGPSHGIGSGLDRLLERNGLDPRPLMVTRFVAARVRFEYTGTSTSLSDSGANPLYTDRYSTSGHFVPAVAMERVVVVDMEPGAPSFTTLDQCTCEDREGPDVPTREQVEVQIRRRMNWPHWNWEILDQRLLYGSTGGANCRHAITWSSPGHRITEAFPEAQPLARVIEAEVVHDIVVGDTVEITEAHDGMEQGWRFTVNHCDYEEGSLTGSSPEHTTYEQWSIDREYCVRVNPRVGERVYLTQDSLGLRQGQGLIVVAPPWESPSGPRLSGTRVDLSDHFVYTVDAAHVRIDPLGGDAPF